QQMSIGKLIYDNVDLSSLFTTKDIHFNLLNQEVETSQVGNSDGVKITNVRLGENEIKVEIFFDYTQLKNAGIKSEFELKRLISETFYTNETKNLTWSKDPDIYYNAIYENNSELTFNADRTVETELTFKVPDGVGHKVYPTISTNLKDGSI